MVIQTNPRGIIRGQIQVNNQQLSMETWEHHLIWPVAITFNLLGLDVDFNFYYHKTRSAAAGLNKGNAERPILVNHVSAMCLTFLDTFLQQ